MPDYFKVKVVRLHRLRQGVSCRYLLSLSLVEESGGCLVSEEVGTVWGHEGVPRRRRGEEDQNHFRWFQVSDEHNVADMR